MSCKILRNNIDHYLDQQLDPAATAALRQHIESCVACQTEYQHGRLLQTALATMPDEVSREGFFQTAFDAVRLQYPEAVRNTPTPRKQWLQMGLASAAIAGFVLWAIISVFLLPRQNQLPVVHLTLKQSTMIPLAFNASDNFDKVTISMQIPPQVELKGHKGKRSLSWDTYLKKGSNLLKLPLIAVTQGDGLFVAKLKHGNKVKTFKFHLRVDQKDLSIKQSPLELFPA